MNMDHFEKDVLSTSKVGNYTLCMEIALVLARKQSDWPSGRYVYSRVSSVKDNELVYTVRTQILIETFNI